MDPTYSASYDQASQVLEQTGHSCIIYATQSLAPYTTSASSAARMIQWAPPGRVSLQALLDVLTAKKNKPTVQTIRDIRKNAEASSTSVLWDNSTPMAASGSTKRKLKSLTEALSLALDVLGKDMQDSSWITIEDEQTGRRINQLNITCLRQAASLGNTALSAPSRRLEDHLRHLEVYEETKKILQNMLFYYAASGSPLACPEGKRTASSCFVYLDATQDGNITKFRRETCFSHQGIDLELSAEAANRGMIGNSSDGNCSETEVPPVFWIAFQDLTTQR